MNATTPKLHPTTGMPALFTNSRGRSFYPIAGGDPSGDAEPGRIGELATQIEALRSEIVELDAVAEPTDEQATRFDAALTEFDTATAEHTRLVERANRVEGVRSAALATVNRERGAGPDVIVRNRRDPFEDLGAVRAGTVSEGDLRSRALNAIEDAPEHMSDAAREQATSLVQGQGRHAAGIARHLLLTGSEAYHAEFEEYGRTGYVGEQMRAAMSSADANGGFLVPFTLDPTIIMTNDGTANPFRQTASVRTIVTDTWNGVTSAGVTASWTAEAAETTDASPTFGQPSIKAEKADAYIEGSYEILADSGFMSEFGMLLADAKDRLESAAFATGDGNDKPFGVITGLVAGGKTVASATTDTYAVADVYATQTAVPSRHRSKAVWFANQAIMNRTRQFDTAGGSAFWANLGAATPEQLLGRPIYEASELDGVINATQDNFVLPFIDMSAYYIIDRVGMSVLYEPLVKGANRRPTGQAGWYAFWRVGGKLVNANAGRLLNVT